MKTEHSGAKNGGGHWGTREEAKEESKKLRRQMDKSEVKKELKEGVCLKSHSVEVNESQLSQNLKANISPCCFSTLEFIPNKTYKRCRTCGTCYEAAP